MATSQESGTLDPVTCIRCGDAGDGGARRSAALEGRAMLGVRAPADPPPSSRTGAGRFLCSHSSPPSGWASTMSPSEFQVWPFGVALRP